MGKRRGAEYRIDAPGLDAREWAVVKIHIPVPWKYINDSSLSASDVADKMSDEIGAYRWAFEGEIERMRQDRKARLEGRLPDG